MYLSSRRRLKQKNMNCLFSAQLFRIRLKQGFTTDLSPVRTKIVEHPSIPIHDRVVFFVLAIHQIKNGTFLQGAMEPYNEATFSSRKENTSSYTNSIFLLQSYYKINMRCTLLLALLIVDNKLHTLHQSSSLLILLSERPLRNC